MPDWPLLLSAMLVAWLGLSITVGILLGGMTRRCGQAAAGQPAHGRDGRRRATSR